MNERTTIRAYSIDSLKMICAIMVLISHCNTIASDAFNPISRSAVPCFFIISGYFLYSKLGRERLGINMKRILLLLLKFTFVYALLRGLIYYFHWGAFIIVDNPITSFLLFNENPFGYHLWYLSAYLYALIILYFFCNYINSKSLACLFVTSVVCFLVSIGIGRYGFYWLSEPLPAYVTRNFFFTALPCVLIGCSINGLNVRIKTKWSLILFITSIIALYLEVYTCSPTEGWGDYYFSTLPIAISLFLLFNSITFENNLFSRWGCRDSLYLYLLHPMVKIPLVEVWNRAHFTEIEALSLSFPILLFSATMIFIYLLKKIKLV